MLNTIDGDDGIFTAEQVEAAIRPYKRNRPRPRLVSVEQTSNFGGGSVWPIEQLKEVRGVAKPPGPGLHIDRARLMTAAVPAVVQASAFASLVWTCDV